MSINTSKIIDGVLECSVIGGFSRIGYEVRSRTANWTPLNSYDLSGKTVVVTGPTSGLGRSVAFHLRKLNAHLILVARNQNKLDALISELQGVTGTATVNGVIADMGDIESVKTASQQISQLCSELYALIHNAGSLFSERQENSSGIEVTVASHVVGPFVMTSQLIPLLRSGQGRVVTVSSGGMYAARLPHLQQGESLELPKKNYSGSRQYAVAKRAQVTLNEMWAKKEPAVAFHAMHPGWADTPGVQEAMPKFRSITKNILRTQEQGADTIVWLVAEPDVSASNGSFWCDRSPRSIHRLPTTKRSDTESARTALWAWCESHLQ